jgi:hypothetical protein
MTHPLAGRKQSPEHIRRRVEAVAKTMVTHTLEQRLQHRRKIGEANMQRPKEMRDRFAKCNIGREPWNKGKRNLRQSGPRHWNWGGKMPQESIEKMRQTKIGKKQTLDHVEKRVEGRKGYTHSEDTRKKISETNRRLFANGLRDRRASEDNPCWKGADHPRAYPSTWNFRLREMIRERDGRECLICGAPENGRRHDVHHQDYDKSNLDPSNLKTLCIPCHRKTVHMEKYWRKIFRPDELATRN